MPSSLLDAPPNAQISTHSTHPRLTHQQHEYKRTQTFERSLFQSFPKKRQKNSYTQQNTKKYTPSKSFLQRLASLIFKKHIFNVDLHQKTMHQSILLQNLWTMGLLGLPGSGRHAIAWNLIGIFSMKKQNSDQKRNAFVNAFGTVNEEQFFSYEPKAYVRFIHANLINSMFALCEASRVLFDYNVKSESERYIEIIFNEFEALNMRPQAHYPPQHYRLDLSAVVSIRQLWMTEPSVRAAFKRRHQIRLPQNVTVCPNLHYFMWRLPHIARPDYVPTSRDICNLPLGESIYRRRFHSSVPPNMLIRYRKDIRFINNPLISFHLLQHSYFHGIDVPFQLIMPTQRNAFPKFINSFNFIIYTVDLTSYAQINADGTTKLHDVLQHLREVVQSAPQGTPVYLFFTHLDSFMDVARDIDFVVHDPNRPVQLAHLHYSRVFWSMESGSETEKVQVVFDFQSGRFEWRNVEAPRVTLQRHAEKKLREEFGQGDEQTVEFPSETSILKHIFSYLDVQSLVRVGRTNYTNYVVSCLDELWMPICRAEDLHLTHYTVSKLYKQYLRPPKRRQGRVIPCPHQYWRKMYATNGYAKFKYLEHITNLVSRVVSCDDNCDLRGTFCVTVSNEKLLRKAVSAVIVDFMQLKVAKEKE